jgi:hypothetical protein
MSPKASVLKVSSFFFAMIVKCWFQPYDTFTMASDDDVTKQAGYRSHRMPVMCAIMALDADQFENEFKNCDQARTPGCGLRDTTEHAAFATAFNLFKDATHDMPGVSGEDLRLEVQQTHDMYFTTIKEQLNEKNMQWFTRCVYTILGDTFPGVHHVTELKDGLQELLRVVALNQVSWLEQE